VSSSSTPTGPWSRGYGTVQEGIQWLPPTPANLAGLSVAIPARYRRVHYSVTSESRGGIQYFVAGPGH
jgi:hypothetical protein